MMIAKLQLLYRYNLVFLSSMALHMTVVTAIAAVVNPRVLVAHPNSTIQLDTRSTAYDEYDSLEERGPKFADSKAIGGALPWLQTPNFFKTLLRLRKRLTENQKKVIDRGLKGQSLTNTINRLIRSITPQAIRQSESLLCLLHGLNKEKQELAIEHLSSQLMEKQNIKPALSILMNERANTDYYGDRVLHAALDKLKLTVSPDKMFFLMELDEITHPREFIMSKDVVNWYKFAKRIERDPFHVLLNKMRAIEENQKVWAETVLEQFKVENTIFLGDLLDGLIPSESYHLTTSIAANYLKSGTFRRAFHQDANAALNKVSLIGWIPLAKLLYMMREQGNEQGLYFRAFIHVIEDWESDILSLKTNLLANKLFLDWIAFWEWQNGSGMQKAEEILLQLLNGKNYWTFILASSVTSKKFSPVISKLYFHFLLNRPVNLS
ncbi:hypothetical protein Plhal304r1_c011g0042951 [Plasmopara halstedii]